MKLVSQLHVEAQCDLSINAIPRVLHSESSIYITFFHCLFAGFFTGFEHLHIQIFNLSSPFMILSIVAFVSNVFVYVPVFFKAQYLWL